MSEVILRIQNFSKNFRSHWTFRPIQAVKDISFEIYEGECFGFLGHNGAGKTTTIKSLLGLIHKTSGEFYFYDKPLKSPTQRVSFGFLPEHPYFYEHLSVEETLDFFGSLHGISSTKRRHLSSELLEKVGLSHKSKSPVRALSKGLQQKLGFAQAIMNSPKLLFLDEPFSGLDPVGRMEIRRLISELNKQGTTIFMSSHILSDVENMCDRAAILKSGELKTIVTLKGAERDFKGTSFKLTVENCPALTSILNDESLKPDHSEAENLAYSSLIALSYNNYDHALNALNKSHQLGIRVSSFIEERPSLEDVFINIVKGQ